jgi:hypothetical protein
VEETRSFPDGEERLDRRDSMASSKRQTTMAKLTRERKVQEKRELKQAKKQAAAELRRTGESPVPADPIEGEMPTAAEEGAGEADSR